MSKKIKNDEKDVQYVYVKESNTIGKAGFFINLVALVLGMTGIGAIAGFILWLLGTLFSIIGLFKRPRGMAIAGIVLAFLGAIPIILFGLLAAAASAS